MSGKRHGDDKKKVKPGDGKALHPFRSWHALWRSLFHLDIVVPGGTVADRYAVEVNYFDWDDETHLYRNGKRVATAALPASFPVPGGRIEVAATTFGLKRMHFVGEDGTERQLRPDPRTAEAWRARLDRNAPRLSRAISVASVLVLVVSLVLLVPQVIEWITSIPWVAAGVGTFESPIALPEWLSTALVVAGFAAAVERALRLRYHWLLDADTWWIGD